MLSRTFTHFAFRTSSLWLAACAGASKSSGSTNSPSAAGSASSEAASAATPDTPATVASADGGAAPSADTPTPATAASKPSRPPHDVLEAKDTVFFLSYDDSDPQKKAETVCTKHSKNDPKKMASCMTKARGKIDAEGQRFIEDKTGNPWYVVVRHKGATLVTLHKVRFTFGEETADSIVIKPEGKDNGSKPWKKPPAEIKFEVPSDDRIEVVDHKFGKLVYEAKVGVTGK